MGADPRCPKHLAREPLDRHRAEAIKEFGIVEQR
jgi:hypothetical protein